MKHKRIIFAALALIFVLALAGVMAASAVSGAAFTTFNPWVDGFFKEVCKNSIINCNIYGDKEYVWLNGGPAANGLGPDGEYFFAVLVPGGQPDPNDGGAKNLSDDYDAYTNRTFTVTDGEVSAYAGDHDLDSGDTIDSNRQYCHSKKGCLPDGEPPLIRLAPYADTTNPGGVYILAICSLADGYPVSPRDCKYDAFKVKEVHTAVLMLSGMKVEDLYADGVKDAGDPGLPGWEITISGTGFLGEPINETITTGEGGYWDYEKEYTFNNKTDLVDAHLTVCEVLQPGWTQSFPDPSCYDLTIPPSALAQVPDLDFGNWLPVQVTACKVRDLDGEPDGETVPVEGWLVTLTKEGEDVETKPTGPGGCYTWPGLKPGYSYDVHEQDKPGWEHLGDVDVVFDRAKSGDSFSHTFVNAVLEGCTPGFWQGGSDGGQAGGQWLWNEVQDPDWVLSGGEGFNPYIWTTLFNSKFTPYAGLDGFDMMSLVGTGGGPDDFQKAARSLVAAYLNASWGMNYAYDTLQLEQMWADAVASGDFLALHLELDAANNAYYRTDGGSHCPISASGW
jgi:hypothetical protein